MIGLAAPSAYIYPLDPKYLFCDAPRVLDGPPGSLKFPHDHYIIGDIKSLLHLKNLAFFITCSNSSVGIAEDFRLKGPRIETRCCQFFCDIAIFFKMVQN